MLKLMCPIFGDLMLDAVAAGAWLFILALIASAWWERRQARIIRELARGQAASEAMNETFLSRIGRLFFPRLAPDQRQHRMVIILSIVLITSFCAGTLVLWMMSTRGINIKMGLGLPFGQK